MITTFTLYVPDWSFTIRHHDRLESFTVECGMRGHLGPACNAVGYVDREVWGINHLYSQPVWSRLKETRNHIEYVVATVATKSRLLEIVATDQLQNECAKLDAISISVIETAGTFSVFMHTCVCI